MSNKTSKLLAGLAIGVAVGAIVAYFSDNKRRNDFIDDVTDYGDKVKSNIKDAYYDGKIRARKAKRDLSRYMADIKDEAGHLYDDVVSTAKSVGKKAKESAEELVDLTQEELEDLKETAREEAEKLTKK